MEARDYIYCTLSESMKVVKDDIETLASYIDLDFEDYFSSQIVKDENGIEVLSEVADEYVSGKVVCTAEEGREMFDEIRDEALTEILQDIVDYYDGLEEISEFDIKDIELDDYGKRFDYYKHKDINFKWIGEVNDEIDSYSDSWMDDLYDFCYCQCHLNITKGQFAFLIGATHVFSDEDTRFNDTNDITIAYFREYDGDYTQSTDKTVTCEVQQVVGEMQIGNFDIIVLKGDNDAIDRAGEKYNYRFYDPTFLRECVTDFMRLLYNDLYDEETGCYDGCFDPYIFVNYDLGLVINSYEEHIRDEDFDFYDREQLITLRDFALQDEDSELADMVTNNICR